MDSKDGLNKNFFHMRGVRKLLLVKYNKEFYWVPISTIPGVLGVWKFFLCVALFLFQFFSRSILKRYIFDLSTIVLIKGFGLRLFLYISKGTKLKLNCPSSFYHGENYKHVIQLFWWRIVTRPFTWFINFIFICHTP